MFIRNRNKQEVKKHVLFKAITRYNVLEAKIDVQTSPKNDLCLDPKDGRVTNESNENANKSEKLHVTNKIDIY